MGILSAEFTKLEGGFRTYHGTTQNAYYTAIGDDPDQDVWSVLTGMWALSSPVFPTPFAWLINDPSSRAQDFEVRQHRGDEGTGGSGDFYTIRVEFSPIRPGQPYSSGGGLGQGGGYSENPVLWPVTTRVERIPTYRKLMQARNLIDLKRSDGTTWRPLGTLGPIVNAAGQLVDFEFEVESFRRELVATKYYANDAAIEAVAAAYSNTLNNATWKGKAAGFARFKSITAGDVQEYRGNAYHQATIRVELLDEAFAFDVPNVGLFEAYQDANQDWKLANIYRDGIPVSEPMPLKPDGTQEPDYDQVTNVIPYQPDIALANYTALGIGS